MIPRQERGQNEEPRRNNRQSSNRRNNAQDWLLEDILFWTVSTVGYILLITAIWLSRYLTFTKQSDIWDLFSSPVKSDIDWDYISDKKEELGSEVLYYTFTLAYILINGYLIVFMVCRLITVWKADFIEIRSMVLLLIIFAFMIRFYFIIIYHREWSHFDLYTWMEKDKDYFRKMNLSPEDITKLNKVVDDGKRRVLGSEAFWFYTDILVFAIYCILLLLSGIQYLHVKKRYDRLNRQDSEEQINQSS